MGGQEIKLPPQNVEAEQSVLGAMLIDEDAIGSALEILDASWFYEEAHRLIYSAVLHLYNERKSVDIITLSDRLRNDKTLETVGGVPYLSRLVDMVPSSANVAFYANIVKEKGILRSLIKNSTQIINHCYESGSTIDEVVDSAEKLIFEVADIRHQRSTIDIKDLVKTSIAKIDRLYQRQEKVTGISSGFTDFDRMTSGLQPSDLIILAGRPSMGKSALAGSILEHVAMDQNKPVAFFSLEMSKEQLVQRMLCSQARIDANKVRTGFLSGSDWPLLTKAAGKLSASKIFIDDTPALSALELRAKARRLKTQHEIELIVIDYIQLMRGSARAESRQQEISEISRSIKALARELGVPIIALSQLSRAVESRPDHRPQLSDLRESGAIEQDADVVVLLMREEYYNPTEENAGKAEVILAKQRNGPVGSIKLAFIKEFVRFENLAHVD
ncbi:MAG: replicative DNA helicase [Candidatus Omnitrophota bacterium]